MLACGDLLDEEVGDGGVEVPVGRLQTVSEHHSNVAANLLTRTFALQLCLPDHVLDAAATNTSPVNHYHRFRTIISLPDYLRDPTRSFDSFHSALKTFLFSLY